MKLSVIVAISGHLEHVELLAGHVLCTGHFELLSGHVEQERTITFVYIGYMLIVDTEIAR